MSAHADDLRYVYAEDLGDTIEQTVGLASTQLRDEPLEPGRYALRVIDFGAATAVWVRQGAHGDVTAAASAPSMRFHPPTDDGFLNYPMLTFIVREGGKGPNPATARNQLAFIGVGAADAVVQVTKISRGRR